MNPRLLAAHLLKEMDSGDSLNSALFVAAFSELDELRERLEKIPADVDQAANRFNSTTVNAVDDFVYVANEALSKFMQRTNEINAILVQVENTSNALKPIAAALEQQAKAAVENKGNTKRPENETSFLTLPFVSLLCASCSIISFLLAYFFFS